MNCLNSVLFEGCLHSDPVETVFDNSTRQVQFELKSTKVTKVENGEVASKDIVVDILVLGGKLRRSVMDTLKKGRGIRVVGFLDSDRIDSESEGRRLWVTAEHIEFKPEKSKKITEHENENK